MEGWVDGWVIHDNSLGGPARDPSILFPVILRGGEFLIVIVHGVVAIGWVDLVLVTEFRISGVEIIFDGVGQVHIVVVAWVITVGWVYFVHHIRGCRRSGLYPKCCCGRSRWVLKGSSRRGLGCCNYSLSCPRRRPVYCSSNTSCRLDSKTLKGGCWGSKMD